MKIDLHTFQTLLHWSTGLIFRAVLVAACALAVQTLSAQTTTYLVNGKPVSEQVYRATVLMNEANKLIDSNRLGEATQKLTDALGLAPDYPEIHYNFGVVLVRLGEEEGAAQHFEAVVESRAELPSAWMLLGGIYVKHEKYDKAITVFTDAANRFADQTWQDKPEFYHNYGVALTKLGHTEKAVQQLELALRAKTELPDAWMLLGSIYTTHGKYDDAIRVFTDAANRFPEKTWQDKPEYYHNYGFALAKLGRAEKAIEQVKLALGAKTELPDAWMLLGTLYQSTGQLEDSIKYYREFVRRFPNRPEVFVLVDVIRLMRDELSAAKSQPVTASTHVPNEDYYPAISRTGAKVWPPKAMPLRVHIHSGESVSGFQPQFVEILKAAFHEWSRVSQGRVTVKFVDKDTGADIVCSWTSDPSQLRNRSESGETQVYFSPSGSIQRATIVILTVPILQIRPVTDSLIRFIALHEVGHALGIMAHSTNPTDIMFFSEPLADDKRDLSARDNKTLVRLYSRK